MLSQLTDMKLDLYESHLTAPVRLEGLCLPSTVTHKVPGHAKKEGSSATSDEEEKRYVMQALDRYHKPMCDGTYRSSESSIHEITFMWTGVDMTVHMRVWRQVRKKLRSASMQSDGMTIERL